MSSIVSLLPPVCLTPFSMSVAMLSFFSCMRVIRSSMVSEHRNLPDKKKTTYDD